MRGGDEADTGQDTGSLAAGQVTDGGCPCFAPVWKMQASGIKFVCFHKGHRVAGPQQEGPAKFVLVESIMTDEHDILKTSSYRLDRRMVIPAETWPDAGDIVRAKDVELPAGVSYESLEAQIPHEDLQVAKGTHPFVKSTKESIFLSFAVREDQPAAQEEVRTAGQMRYQQHRQQQSDDTRHERMLHARENWPPPPDQEVYGFGHAVQQVSATATKDEST